MKDQLFEEHRLEEKNEPIICHYNRVVENSMEHANWHPNIECLLFTEGAGVAVCEGEEFRVAAGDLFIVNPNRLHRFIGDKELCYHCLIVDSSFVYRFGLDLSRLAFEQLIRDGAVNEKYMRVVREFQGDAPFRDTAVRTAVMELLLHLARAYRSSDGSMRRTPPSSDEGVRLAIGYIHAHIEDALNLETLAEAVGFSKYYLIRIFSRMTGQTPMQYINKARCERARALLQNGYAPKRVAEQMHFADLAYFSKFFKKHMGQTPSAFLAACRKEKISKLLEGENTSRLG